jgi:hypothetical protein
LATVRGLDGDNVSGWVERLLAEQTVTIVPLLNVDGAIRI